MIDIVERLLDQDSDWIYTERAEAAVEITRLRAELAEERKLRPFEPANYIKSPEDLAAYRQAVREGAFEEAAKVAEGEKCSDAIVAAENIAGSGDAWLVNHICDEIAQAIRAMIDKG